MRQMFHKGFFWSFVIWFGCETFAQSVTINGAGTGRLFDGLGAVSGGGATSVFLTDYPEPYRSQIMDYLFKPNFGASMTALFVEIGGDGNSTQGSEPSHMHTKNDTNFQRGYEWWLMREAKKRNPAITLDGVAWGCPGWIGNGNFWSTDMQNYYITWIRGLKSRYGYDLDAIGCRNEKGTDFNFAIQFRAALNSAGFSGVKLHAFDNWQNNKFDFVNDFATNTALKNAIDIIGAHSLHENSQALTTAARNSGKPIWSTEEHAYLAGYSCAQAIVKYTNENYLNYLCTKHVYWYLIEAFYSLEGFTNQTLAVANQPWSGNYVINPGLWGYAHYNQFVKVGWQFIDAACGKLTGGGTYVTLKSPKNDDFSIIAETQGANGNQTVAFTISGGLPADKPLCIWRSTGAADMFVKQADIPAGASFSITLAANSIYSISTTTGQSKGNIADVPASQDFPFPYFENFDHYTNSSSNGDQKCWGYKPYYFADICGVFEIANRPDGAGKCLRQVLNQKANSWPPEWAPFTIIGSKNWTNYEVSADVFFDGGGWASVMGRLNGTLGGYGAYPRGYYLQLASSGAWKVIRATSTGGSEGAVLASGTVTLTAGEWNNIKLRMQGTTLTAFVKSAQVWTGTSDNFGNGMAGLGTGGVDDTRNTAMFDNFMINTPDGATPTPTVFKQDTTPPYPPLTVGSRMPASAIHETPTTLSFKLVGDHVAVPKELSGRSVSIAVYDLNGALLQKIKTRKSAVDFCNKNRKSRKVRVVQMNYSGASFEVSK